MKFLKLSEGELCRIIAEHLTRVQGMEGIQDFNVEFATDREGRPIALVLLPAEKPSVPNPYPDRIGEAREPDAPIKRGISVEEVATRMEDSTPPIMTLDEVAAAEDDDVPKKRAKKPERNNVAADILGGDGGIMDRGQGLGTGVGADRKRAR